MTFNITAVPHSLRTPDGFVTKTDKSKLLKHVTADAQDIRLPRGDRSILFIEAGSARLNWLVDITNIFGGTALKLL